MNSGHSESSYAENKVTPRPGSDQWAVGRDLLVSQPAPGTWQVIVVKMQRIHRLNSGWCCFRETDPEVRWLVASCGLISDNKEWPWPGRARGGPPSRPATESCPGEVSAGGAGRGGRWALTRGGAAAVCCLHRRPLHTTFRFTKPFHKYGVRNVSIF